MKCLTLLPLLVVFAGCAKDSDTSSDTGTTTEDSGSTDTEDTDTEDTDTEDTDTEDTDTEDTTADYEVFESEIDASSRQDWVYFDLETQSMVDASSADWDLTFKRFEVKINGGISGSGSVEVAALEGYYDAFETTLRASPHQPWTTDSTDGLAFGSWYDYNPNGHIVSPADVLYVVHTGSGDYYRFRFMDYYNANGESGFLSLQFGPIEGY